MPRVCPVLISEGQSFPVAVPYLERRAKIQRDRQIIRKGVVLGSKAFVNGVFAANRERFGAKRKDGARRLRYLEDAPLFALRDLRINPVG